MPLFWPKTVIFCDFKNVLKMYFFRGKVLFFLGKWSNWPKNWYKCTLGPLLQLLPNLNLIFGVFAILQDPICAEGVYFGQFWAIFTKNSRLRTYRVRKMPKTPNILFKIGNNCSRGPKVHLYQFLGQLDHFPRNA